jgi:glycosyltransferase involved in cell wall biosynthesis
MFSLIIPVYKNAENIPSLFEALVGLSTKLPSALEVVFVVDGSPDESYLRLRERLPTPSFQSQLLALSRNFGSFSATRAGLATARGERIAVMAADLQEPPELMVDFDRILSTGDVDIVVGQRASRSDPLLSRLFSSLFWFAYRRWVQRDVPAGGVDVFGCTDAVRRELVRLEETNSSLVGLLFWVGFRRALVPYTRRSRAIGRSAWTLSKKVRYLSDSMFAFSDLPIRLLLVIGALGVFISISYATVVLVAKAFFSIAVPGYAATAALISFFGGLNCLGTGFLGGYLWRTFENSKRRPNYVIRSKEVFDGIP